MPIDFIWIWFIWKIYFIIISISLENENTNIDNNNNNNKGIFSHENLTENIYNLLIFFAYFLYEINED